MVMKPKQVMRCLMRNMWVVYNHQLQREVGWFSTKREAELCAAQLEMEI
jgi:hypothetical protein